MSKNAEKLLIVCSQRFLFITIFIFVVFGCFANRSFAQEGVSDYLCEIGEGFYLKGSYDEALREFNKALMVNPDNARAKSYIQKITARNKPQAPVREVEPARKEIVQPVPESSLPAKTEIVPQRKIIPLDKVREPSVEPAPAGGTPRTKVLWVPSRGIKKAAPVPVSTEKPRQYLPVKARQEKAVEKEAVKKGPVVPALSKIQVVDMTLARVEKELIGPAADKAAERFSGEKKEKKESPPGFKVSGVYQLALGGSSDGFEWKKANGDLFERNWRVISDAALNNRENTFDYRIFDRFRMDIDSLNPAGLNFHTNITVDPWSFTGKSEKITLTGSGTGSGGNKDTAEIELKYWSNTGRIINESFNTLQNGDSFSVPEIKVEDGKTSATTVKSSFSNTFDIPSLKIQRQFQPVRELWFDYQQEDSYKFRFFPMATANQALTSDDPLGLSNKHIYWEESPWQLSWKPGTVNSQGTQPDDFTRGKWDNALSFFTRDSDLVRLTALRGFSFDYFPSDETSFKLTGASPKGLWQDYDSFDNVPAAMRFKQKAGDNLQIGNTYIFRMGLNEAKGNKMDSLTHAGGLDLSLSPVPGTKIETEAAFSSAKQDMTSSTYKSRKKGFAYHLALIGSPERDILDSSYNQIRPKETDTSFLKARLMFTHMDKGFESPLASYRHTRRDQFWSRHIHFRKPPQYYWSDADLSNPSLTWDDIAQYAVGDGIDYGRDVIGFRVEISSFERRLDEFFDVRNVHESGGKYIENVARSETTFKATDKLTAKALLIHHDAHQTYGGKDPFLTDPQIDRVLDNSIIPDSKSPSMKTFSLGLNYDFFDWLATYGVWEYSNDINNAFDGYPRSILNGSSFETYSEYGKTFRRQTTYLYNQYFFPLPPYPFNNAYKFGLTLRPSEKWEIFLDYTRSEYEYANQLSDDINHIGLEIAYHLTKRVGFFAKYVFSQANDLVRMNTGEGVFYESHNNFFLESRFGFSDDDELTFQFGEYGRSPLAILGLDPYGGSLSVLDTQYIYRLFYRRKF